MKKKISFWMALLVISALILSACGGAAPASSTVESTFVGLCADPRCGPVLTFGDMPAHENWIINRSVAGGASRLPSNYVFDIERRTGLKVKNAFLVAHVADNCPTCGGLNASDSIRFGTFTGPAETGEYIQKFVPSYDAYAGLKLSVKSYTDQGIKNITLAIQDNVTGQIYPMAVIRDGREVIQIAETSWVEFLDKGGQMPSLAFDAVDPYAQQLLRLNANALPRYAEYAKTLDFASGSRINAALVTTKFDFASLAQFDNGSTYALTSTLANSSDLGGQLAYGLLHRQSTPTMPFRLYVQTDTGNQLASVLESINKSPTLQGIISNPADDAMVSWWQGSLRNRALRVSNVPMSRLVAPISGSSLDELVVVAPQVTLANGLSRQAVADAFGAEGLVLDVATADRIVALAPSQVAARAFGIGVAGAVIIYSTAEQGYIFGFGDHIMLPSANIQPAGDGLISADSRAGLLSNAPFSATRVESFGNLPNLYTIRDQMWERQSRGEDPCLGITQDDWSLDVVVPSINDFMESDQLVHAVICPVRTLENGVMTDLVVINIDYPSHRITFSGASGQYQLVGTTTALTSPINTTLLPEYVCTKTLSFDYVGNQYYPRIENACNRQ